MCPLHFFPIVFDLYLSKTNSPIHQKLIFCSLHTSSTQANSKSNLVQSTKLVLTNHVFIQDDETVDGETFIEKYTRGVSAVETILTLDRLRQSVAVKELVNAKAKQHQPANLISNSLTSSQFMRKTVSVPNISHVSLFYIYQIDL